MGIRARTWLNIGFSLTLHAAVLLLLGLSFAFSPSHLPTPRGAIQAVAVDEQEVQAEIQRTQAQRHEQQSDEAQKIAQLDAQTQQLDQEQQRLAELKKQREQLQQEQMAAQRKAEQQRLAKLKEQRAKEEQRLAELHKQQQAKAEALAEKQRRLEQQKRQEAEAKRQAEQQRLAKLKKQQEEERQQAAAEAARKAALEKKMAEEAAARAYARKVATAKADYIPAIKRNVAQNWLRPAGTPHGLSCVIHVRMGVDGIVLNAQVVQSSGNTAFDRSAEVAVRKASPLPVPNDPELASTFRDLNFEFQPSS